MRKTGILLIAVVFTFAFGLAYAYAGDMQNGVTDFSGTTHDLLLPSAGIAAHSIEGVSAGGLRTEGETFFNGVTDFTGTTHDTLEMNAGVTTNSVEGENAGGLRQKASYGASANNDVSYDSLLMNPALGK